MQNAMACDAVKAPTDVRVRHTGRAVGPCHVWFTLAAGEIVFDDQSLADLFFYSSGPVGEFFPNWNQTPNAMSCDTGKPIYPRWPTLAFAARGVRLARSRSVDQSDGQEDCFTRRNMAVFYVSGPIGYISQLESNAKRNDLPPGRCRHSPHAARGWALSRLVDRKSRC